MLPRTSRRRTGASLVELLVVIAVITTLAALTAGAVQRVRVVGPQTENYSRLNQISAGISQLKNDLRMDYIPSHPVSPGGFTLKRVYAGTEPELEFLLRAFPNMNTTANPGPLGQTDNGLPAALDGVTLDANQTLCFFLCGVGDVAGTTNCGLGFSNNPRQPFTPANVGEQRKGPWVQAGPTMLRPGPGGFPHLVDVYGTPLAYFASVGGKVNNYGTQTFQTVVSPYQLAAGKFINEKSFQIISAGRDKTFGPGGTNFPASGDPGGADDQGNFTRSLLGNGRL